MQGPYCPYFFNTLFTDAVMWQACSLLLLEWPQASATCEDIVASVLPDTWISRVFLATYLSLINVTLAYPCARGARGVRVGCGIPSGVLTPHGTPPNPRTRALLLHTTHAPRAFQCLADGHVASLHASLLMNTQLRNIASCQKNMLLQFVHVIWHLWRMTYDHFHGKLSIWRLLCVCTRP